MKETRHTGNQEGMVLATALLLTLISMIVIFTAIYYITQGTGMSGMQKRYQTALEASHGALDLTARQVLPKAIAKTWKLSDLQSTVYGASFLPSVTTDACFSEKLSVATKDWAVCSKTDLLNPKTTPDMKLTLKSNAGNPDYDVYVKVVDTAVGNSDTTGGGESLIGHGVVDPGILTPPHYPYMYRIEIQGERQQNPDERAQLSVLYAY